MEGSTEVSVPITPRPEEYERVVAELVDRRSFGAVAISTSVVGTLGMGRSTLARAICSDSRVQAAYPDGSIWVNLGSSLSPLELLAKIERLMYDLTGERYGVRDVVEAEEKLREILHSRRVLLVIDNAEREDLYRPFLHTGPAGACLLVTNQPDALVLGTRSVSLDIMMPAEAAALLVAGILVPQAPGTAAQPSDPFRGTTLPELQTANAETQIAEPSILAILNGMDRQKKAAAELPHLGEEELRLVTEITGRLNEWPLLLALVNGLIRGILADSGGSGEVLLVHALRKADELLKREGLSQDWAFDDPVAREKAVKYVINACLNSVDSSDCQRFFDLSVFEAGEDIPVSAVALLWSMSRGEAQVVCERLASRALIRFDSGSAAIQLHQVVHDFLRDQLRVGVLTELHIQLVKSYALHCKNNPESAGAAGWATGPNDGYFFQHIARHMVGAGWQTGLQHLLFEFDWLLAYLISERTASPQDAPCDLYTLLNDYDVALSSALDRQSAELRLVQGALQMAAPVLVRDPGQLAAQLLGRLLPFTDLEIQSLLRKALTYRVPHDERSWLLPVAACFDQPGGDEVRTLSGHDDWVTGLAFLPDEQFAVSSSLDGTVRLWDLSNGQMVRSIIAHPGASGGVSDVAVTPDGRCVITSGWDGIVRVWELATGRELRSFLAHSASIGAITVSKDARKVITGADDRLVRIWDIESGEKVRELIGHGDLIRCLAVSPDGRTLVSGSWDYTVRTWDIETGEQTHFMTGHEGWVRAVAVSPDGRFVLSGGWDRVVKIWDLASGDLLRTMAGFSAPVFAITLTPDNKIIMTGSGNGALEMWDTQTGEKLRGLDGHQGGINGLAITSGGRFAISASDDRSLKVWDLVAVVGHRPQPGHSAPIHAMIHTPGLGNDAVVTGSWDGTIKLWDTRTGQEKRVWKGHAGGVTALAVSQDGQRMLSGSRDNTLKVWNTTRDEEERSLPGHAGAVTSVAMTPDGHLGVSGAVDGTLKVWDLENGACIARFQCAESVWSVVIDPEGRSLVASEATGKMYFLEIRR